MGMGIIPRPVGLAHFLCGAHRRINKKCAKGVVRNNGPLLGIRAAVGDCVTILSGIAVMSR
jgi:hypothetical protein